MKELLEQALTDSLEFLASLYFESVHIQAALAELDKTYRAYHNTLCQVAKQ